jgi:hypothetical protein
MSEAIGLNYADRLANARETARSEFATVPNAPGSVNSLAQWVAWFRASRSNDLARSRRSAPLAQLFHRLTALLPLPRESKAKKRDLQPSNNTETIKSAFLRALLESHEDNPINWCSAHHLSLAPILEKYFKIQEIRSGNHGSLPPLAAYALGRAVMQDALTSPQGTDGLALPYLLVEDIDELGLGAIGADDELMGSSILENPNAIAEVRQHVASIGTNPVGTSSLEAEHLKGTVQRWHEANGLEQAVSPQFRLFSIRLPVGHLIRVLARSAPPFAAELLDVLNNPTLLSSIFESSDDDDTKALLELLPFCAPIFDDNTIWTRRCAARLLLDTFENSCLEYRARTPSDSKAPSIDADIQDQLKRRTSDLAALLLKRADGPRLALEWVAHLVYVLVAREVSLSFQQKSSDLRTTRISDLLSAAIDQFGSQQWARPWEVWRMFGGSENRPNVNQTAQKDVKLPEWTDLAGRKDSVTPFAVASVLAMAVARVESPQLEALSWLQRLFTSLDNEPQLPWLAQHPNQSLLNWLAWPIAQIDNPTDFIQTTWENARDIRLQSRFYRVGSEKSATACCAAIVELGLAALRWMSNQTDSNAAKSLATYLQEPIDELRYCMPAMGLHRWSGLVSQLATGFSLIGLLSDSDNCKTFLGRFMGDDDALANAAVHAAASGVSASDLSKNLRAIGVDPVLLRDNWLAWHQNRQRAADVANSPFVNYLSRIADSDG